MRRLVLLCAVALAFGSLAEASVAARVTIRDDRLQPAQVCVQRNGLVQWTNAGTARHRVSSDTRAWPVFALAPGASKSIEFRRLGVFRYHVDGRLEGRVRVLESCGVGGGTGGGGGGGTGGVAPGTRFYEYDVRAVGHIHNHGKVFDGDGRLENEWDWTFDWRGNWDAVRIKIVEGGGSFVAVSTRTSGFPGTVRLVETYDWLWHPHAAFPPSADCQGNLTGVYPATVSVAASAGAGKPRIFAWGQLTNAGGMSWTGAERSQIEPACGDFFPPTPAAAEEFSSPGGFTTEPFQPLLAVHFDRNGGAPRSAPVPALLRGGAFKIESGVHSMTVTTCEGDCSGDNVIEEEYSMVFTPSR